MTSISQQSGLQQQGQSNTRPDTAQGHSRAPSATSGKTSPPESARSYAHATKKSFSQTVAGESDSPSTTNSGSVQGPQHGKSPSTASVKDSNSMQQPPVPGPGGLTIVNGNTAPNNPSLHSDHGRKPSVTISAAGASGYMPNGGPASNPPSRFNSLRFGSLDSQGSPNMTNPSGLSGQSQPALGVSPPVNPQPTSPQAEPTPIPQPMASGGRPPSTLQGQSNINFGNFDSGDSNVSVHPIFCNLCKLLSAFFFFFSFSFFGFKFYYFYPCWR